MEQISRIGMDTSKQFFQLHGVNAAEKVVLRRKLRRKEMLTFFARLAPTVVGLEACGSSHHWARELRKLGHEVRLIAPQHVKPYVRRNKNDAADAEAICEALSRPTMRFVPVKSQDQQAGLMLTGVRDRLVKARTQVGNTIRGYAAEFGLTTAKGLDKVETLLADVQADETVPALGRQAFAELAEEYARLQAQLVRVEAQLAAWRREEEGVRRLLEVPSLGPVGASLLVLKTPEPKSFKTGRDYAAWLGLTPKDHSTGGKLKLGGITRAGDETLRSVLVAGAMAVIQQVKRGRGRAAPWLLDLLTRKPPKLAAVALANRIARVAWKLMVSGERYDPTRGPFASAPAAVPAK